MKLALLLLVPLIASFVGAAVAPQDSERPGYDDTPKLPDGFRVHDKARPWPRVVEPGVGSAPPSDAIVLFDGKGLEAWQRGDGRPAGWRVVDGAMEVVPGSGDVRTRRSFGSCQVHLEWATPSEVEGSSQGRGNSGLFFMERYELQILDSFRNPTYADGQAAALYGQAPPLVNACRGPGVWQSYDVVFEAPRFDESGKLLSPARATVFHNGVLVHHAREFLGATRHRTLPAYEAHAPTGALRLQDHGNPMRFRNVWVREL